MNTLPKQPNKSVIDGIRCLQAVVSRAAPVGVSEVARELGLETTRVHRLLRTLAYIGMLRWTEKRKYAAGPALPVLATQTLHASGFYQVIGPLERLHKELNVVVAFGVLWNRSVSYLYHADPDQPLAQAIASFDVWPATVSGLGVALLALREDEQVAALYEGHVIPEFRSLEALQGRLAKVRRCGYARHNNTLALTMNGSLEAAIGIHSADVSAKTVPNYLPALQRCRDEILAVLA